MRPGALGDILLTLPALDALHEGPKSPFRWRGPCEIEVMGNLAVLSFLPGRSAVTAVSSFDRADLAALFQPDATPPESLQLYLNSFDLILSYATSPEHPFARHLAHTAKGRVLSFDPRPVPGQRMHMCDYLQQPLRELGIAPNAAPPRLMLTAADQQDAVQWWTEHGLDGQPAIAIHPGSGSLSKNWPAEGFVAVAHRLARERGVRIVWLSGSADAATVAAVQRTLDDEEALWLQDPPLSLLAAVLARAVLYLGNDSGVSHLAAAVGVPSVVIFGPTDPAIWAPRGRDVRIVRGTALCAPCDSVRRQSCPQRVCLESVSVDMVMEQAVPRLQRFRQLLRTSVR